jgi:hypothetical protein
MSTPAQHQRFRDRGEHIYQFMDEFLVVCPKCSRWAKVQREDPASTDWFAPRRVTCRHCGMTKRSQERGISRSWHGSPEDDYFHLPLWLQSPCCGDVLWAYNARHLRFLRDYVSSDLRERRRNPKLGWGNGSLASRLPRWMQLAKNRGGILKVIEKLEEKLMGTEPDGPANGSQPIRKRTNRTSPAAGSRR